MTPAVETKPRRRLTGKAIPPALIYETWNGKPVYYRGYRDVLAGETNVAEGQISNVIKSVLCSLLASFLNQHLDRKNYVVALNTGFDLNYRSHIEADVAVLKKEKLGKLKGKYFDVAPKVVIEVDIKADTSEFENGADGYVMQKARKLLDFGVEKVLWIFTSMQRVYVIDRNDSTWYIVDWAEDVPVLESCTLNIKQLLDDEEIAY